MLWQRIFFFIGQDLSYSSPTKSEIRFGRSFLRQYLDKSYFALMGGIDLDMTIAEIPQEETRIELTAIMGGIDIVAPRDINIICKNTSILGGMEFFHDDSGGIFMNKEFERKADIETTKTMYIYSHCILGGIDIK